MSLNTDVETPAVVACALRSAFGDLTYRGPDWLSAVECMWRWHAGAARGLRQLIPTPCPLTHAMTNFCLRVACGRPRDHSLPVPMGSVRMLTLLSGAPRTGDEEKQGGEYTDLE